MKIPGIENITRIAVILPSRGLLFSRTAEELLLNLRGWHYKIFFAHKKPIPECFEEPLQRALKEDFSHIWFVEDDMVLPVDILASLESLNAYVATVDYPVTEKGKGSVFRDYSGKVLYCGTGCLLVKREVFDRLEAPYFRSDIRWNPLNYGTQLKLVGSMYGDEGYGLHDVTFGMKLLKAGIPITALESKIAQRKLVALGKSGTNNGAHRIKEWKLIKRNDQLKRIKSMPLATGAKGVLITVDTPTGGVRVTPKHAENLIKQGLATPVDATQTIIDDMEVKW